ncbi:HD-GYP domain-containing protein [Priestia taiwanensis]|uniref:HD family phosphohydrolase n=1 Tax=Priestia taiwanensis TaxID=1347902 RepID=A0A917AS15_9BACI|nr:HD-GYP domain-containing protein [Priestia taiwanensis]MBM7362902.1 HD-GYP domain-containing protein (c-di-GMP phosphodiesterase class II) [Priestia taiwanensis]GGE66056.1 HD family phosphohydrolase [Priestia taiwanensis]
MEKSNSFEIDNLLDEVLKENIYGEMGGLLLSKGTKVTERQLALLKRHRLEAQRRDRIPMQQFEQLLNDVQLNMDHLRNLIESGEGDLVEEIDGTIETFSGLLEEMLHTRHLAEFIELLQGYDHSIYCHSINVGLLAGLIGKILGFPDKVNHILGQMGFLHDIGKLRIQESILHKPARLSDDEYAHVKKHPIYGYQLLKSNKKINRFVLLGALLHHERLDGTGYPFSLKKEQIPFCVQILSVADTYDAMTAKRTYSKGKSPLYVAEELRKEAFEGKLNAVIILPFIEYIMRQMLNQEVLLNNGKFGKIIYYFEGHPTKPLILVDNECIDLRSRKDLFII